MMTTEFKEWLEANSFDAHGSSRFGCRIHGRRDSGTWNYKRHVYECFHCLIARYKAETGATTIEAVLTQTKGEVK